MTFRFSVRACPGEPVGGLDYGDIVCAGGLGTAASNGYSDMGMRIFFSLQTLLDGVRELVVSRGSRFAFHASDSRFSLVLLGTKEGYEVTGPQGRVGVVEEGELIRSLRAAAEEIAGLFTAESEYAEDYLDSLARFQNFTASHGWRTGRRDTVVHGMTERRPAAPGEPAAVPGADAVLAPSWQRDRQTVPLPMGPMLDAASARRLAAGCRAVGAAHLLRLDLSTGAVTPLRTEGCAGTSPPCLLLTPGHEGALLFEEQGHALVAGTAPFMAAAVAEGTDAARVRFARYARALADRRPALSEVAAAHPPRHRAWARPEEVDPATATARMLSLLRRFVQGTCSAREFAYGWWEARRAAQRDGERALAPLAGLLDRVFLLLEDYAVGPGPAEPGELDDAALRAAVTDAWLRLTRAPGPRGRG
jgi:hypothetical protein